jgi:hypothetical protein
MSPLSQDASQPTSGRTAEKTWWTSTALGSLSRICSSLGRSSQNTEVCLDSDTPWKNSNTSSRSNQITSQSLTLYNSSWSFWSDYWSVYPFFSMNSLSVLSFSIFLL